MSIQGIFNEVKQCGKEFVDGTTFHRFAKAPTLGQAKIALKTVAVALAAGLILGNVIPMSLTFPVVTVFAFSYFNRSYTVEESSLDTKREKNIQVMVQGAIKEPSAAQQFEHKVEDILTSGKHTAEDLITAGKRKTENFLTWLKRLPK